MDDAGFNKIATGAIISMEQAWYAQGVALGNLLHSVALAPGESTNIAMIDWSRKTSANTNSNVSQTEMLSANTFHERSIEEVTESVATEAQNGFSETYSGAKSDSHGYSSGGFVPSPFPIPVMFGASGSGSINKVRGQTVTASDGRRDLFAKMTQGVTDSTQQNANSARTRRASIIKEVSQEEKETLTTRTVTNYNHMHAMSIQYYEVVQIYRTTTRVNKVDKCLFIPMKPINFRNLNSIDRFRDILWLSALNENVRSALNAKMQLVEIKCLTTVRIDQGQRYQPYIEAARLVTGDYVAEDYVGKRDYQPWKIKKDIQLLKIVAGDDDPLFAKRIVITRRNQPDVEWESQDDNTKIDFTLGTPIPIEDIDFIYAEYDENTNQSGQLFLIFSFEEQTFEHYHELYWASEDYVEKSGGYTLELFQFHYSGYSLSDWLIKHLEQNRLHYRPSSMDEHGFSRFINAAVSLFLWK